MSTTRGPITSCQLCPVGRASLGIGHGHCPLADRTRPPGATIHAEGAPADTIWFVKKGTVVLTRSHDREGGTGTRAIRGPGSFLGLEAMVRTTYTDTATAVDEVTVCGGTRDRFDAWLGPAGTPARAALEVVLDSTVDDAPRAAARDGTAVQRLARWLLDEPTPGRLPRRVVADLLGMTPETLSRALAKLRSDGTIAVTRQSIHVKSVDGLFAAAEELVTPRADASRLAR